MDTVKRYWYGYQFKLVWISVQKISYCAILFLTGTLDDTNHCEVIIHWGFSRILNMTIHNKIDVVIMQLSTVNHTVELPNRFIGTDTVLYHFALRCIHP